ncbi:hypothetical protein ACRRTK_005195 [Alexandromys fortis]
MYLDSPQCSLRLEVTSHWQSEDRLSPILEAGVRDFALRWLLPIQPSGHASSSTAVKSHKPVSQCSYQAVSL